MLCFRYIRSLRGCPLNVLRHTSSYKGRRERSSKFNYWFFGGAAVGAAALTLTCNDDHLLREAWAQAVSSTPSTFEPPPRPDLPFYKLAEVKKHGKDAARIWVVYKNGVYDVTEFLASHPGGDKLLLAAGDSVEPFWSIYAQHKTCFVMEILEELRIGNLDPGDLAKAKAARKVDEKDPFAKDPARHPALLVNQEKPFNAESPPSLLIDNFITPNDIFFVRNHMPVPETDEKTHILSVGGLGIRRTVNITVDDLKARFKPYAVVSVVQCAGNRRNDMNEYKKDVLINAGVDPNNEKIKHVQFEGADKDTAGTYYGASIPFHKAMHPDTIIAYEMNGQPVPRDHGYPLRLIVPGTVGARQVKWLRTIRTAENESPSLWQMKDYRAFSPSVQTAADIDFSSVPAIQEYPIQSAIMVPPPGFKVSKCEENIEMQGYAWSGGGRGIIRVEVSADGGKSWFSADLQQENTQDLDTMWAWTLWKAEIPVPLHAKPGDQVELLCKATDRSYNTQPETPAGLWNVRGLLHNAWHRVKVNIVE